VELADGDDTSRFVAADAEQAYAEALLALLNG
jgi:hypothetical protein